nr:MAG TPA: transposase [Caudoviricetes sp.]
MAKTLRDKIESIISFWTFRHISNASMEGFNNKIRWLIEEAYGFRDSKYFKLKIYQLPEISSVKELQFMKKNIEETKILHREGALQE